jgi:hypothetical protein
MRSSILHQKAHPPRHPPPTLPFSPSCPHPPSLRPHLPLFSLPSLIPTFRESPKISYLPFLHRNNKCLVRRHILVSFVIIFCFFRSEWLRGYLSTRPIVRTIATVIRRRRRRRRRRRSHLSPFHFILFFYFFWDLS